MRSCPQCGYPNDDDSDFCVVDPEYAEVGLVEAFVGMGKPSIRALGL